MAFPVVAALGLFGSALGAFSSFRSGRREKKAANEAALNREIEANHAIDESIRNQETQRRQSALFHAKQRAAIAQAGGAYSGTLANLVDQSHTDSELDALNILYSGQTRASSLRSEARALRKSGRLAQSNANLAAGAQLLRGGTNFYAATR